MIQIKKIDKKIYKTKIDNEEVVFEISELASKANSAVLGRHGQTVVFVTVVMSDKDADLDYFPLTVEYEERFYAAGKILGSRFIRREGRPSDEAILSGRLIDRAIRPLFDKRLRKEIQVTVTVLSYDEKNDPDIISLLSTSLALSISEIPWNGSIGCFKKDKLFLAGPKDLINMIEFEGDEVKEEKLIEDFYNGQKEINRLIEFQNKIVKEIGKEKIEIVISEEETQIKKLLSEFLKNKIENAFENKKLDELLVEANNYLKENGFDFNKGLINFVFNELVDNFFIKQVLEFEKRPDKRKLDEIRPLYAEVGLFERTHGSALFVRGETQILAVTTLASPNFQQFIETVEFSGYKRFLLHYNFPAFSTGETGRNRGPGRREIGHGALAAKALNALIPSKDEFPYTIRVVAETLSSNGSTSMASVCAGCLALMDAGVNIKKHVAGISIGLVLDENNLSNFKLLVDIQGPEDHHGGMDFKVAGTELGVTAIQLDVKVKGITEEIFKQALLKAKQARLEIIKFLKTVIKEPRKEISPYAPIILRLNIKKEKIGELIGSGGKTINNFLALGLNQVSIDIDEEGGVYVSGLNRDLVNKVYQAIVEFMKEYEVGEIVEGKIVKILDFGAIVELNNGKDGMIHISELKNDFVKKVEDVVKIGQKVRVKIIRIEEDGKIALSLKALENNL